MGYKKRRFGDALAAAARSGERTRDVHVFFGGTGAVGGTGLFQMLAIYEELMAMRRPSREEVPVLVATGRSRHEIRLFTRRLFRFLESRQGPELRPTPIRNGYLTHSGVFVALENFQLVALPGLDRITHTPPDGRAALTADYLQSIGTRIDAGPRAVVAAMESAMAAMRPFSSFLERYRGEHLADRTAFRYRSVMVGIPLPSLVAYHLDSLDLAARHIPGLAPEQIDRLKDRFTEAVRDDVARIQDTMAENLVVAHTTSVGGMYDEGIGPDGRPRRTIRLGFAHSAQDEFLTAKQKFAERLTELYGKAGINMLITAAAIGIDEVRIRETVPMHRKVEQMLFDAAAAGHPVFSGSAEGQVIRVFPPETVPWESPPPGDLPAISPSRGEVLRPAYAIRSGENGFFTVANAEALYRVMRVASASELGHVIAMVGMFGDDPQSPWFDEQHVCYYTETDNSRQVFDFLAQPLLRATQLSGLEPMALQDLGSAKHQGELHTLGLLILLHRLRTLDIDALPPYVELARFDAQSFFEERSRPLTFEDLDAWELETLARDLAVLASATRAEDLRVLKPFRPRGHDELFPEKEQARLRVLGCVLEAAWAVPSLGSPLIYEKDGKAWVRSGRFVAPLDLLLRTSDGIDRWLRDRHARTGNPCPFEDLRDFHACVGGFVDLRPHAIVCTARNDRQDLRGKVFRARDEEGLRRVLAHVEPYGFFATCGLLAVMFRLRALYSQLKEAMLELGTLQDFRWQMPRDASGHTLVVPGVVEAMRMTAEGLEKTTGTAALDGIWGYERRRVADRRKEILEGKK